MIPMIHEIPADSDHPASRHMAGLDRLRGNLQVALMRLDVQVGWLKQIAPGETERLSEMRAYAADMDAFHRFVEANRWAF